MKLLCTICARAGSKGLKNKNFLRLLGVTLLVRTIKQALKIKSISNIVVSTNAKSFSKIINKKIFYLKRPIRLSGDKIGKIEVIRHALKEAEIFFKKDFDTIIDLDVTAPLRKISDIKKCIKIFKKKNYHNLITVCKSRKNPYFNMIEYKNNKFNYVKKLSKPLLRRQDAPKVYEVNAAIYLWNKKYLNKSINLLSNKTMCYEMPYNESIDIDTKDDLQMVKAFIKNKWIKN